MIGRTQLFAQTETTEAEEAAIALVRYFDACEAFMEHEGGDIAPAIREYEKARDAVKAALAR